MTRLSWLLAVLLTVFGCAPTVAEHTTDRTFHLRVPPLSTDMSNTLPPHQQRRDRRAVRASHTQSPIYFDQPTYTVNMTEGGDVSGSSPVVITMQAHHKSHMSLFYAMVAPEDTRSMHTFGIDRETGLVTLKQSLDRELIDRHVLRVTASDRTNMYTASTTLYVYVQDVQDNAPIFDNTIYTGNIAEDAPVCARVCGLVHIHTAQIGTTVLHVYAHDADAGANGNVTYHIEPSSDTTIDDTLHFHMHPSTGVLQVARRLDREIKDTYRFRVVAGDHGDVARYGNAQIFVEVIDVNDNTPQVRHQFVCAHYVSSCSLSTHLPN
jgi:hypothetical protein